jgi:hypothetical protein
MTDISARPASRPLTTSTRPDPDAADRTAIGHPRWSGSTRCLGAGTLYLLLSVGLWWHVWSAGSSSVMTCDCTDAGRVVWYLQWSAFALSHGHQLLYSNWLFHPGGLNLLTDTSVPAIGLVMSPVTLLFGPVTAINVASTLIPALTALSMFWLLLRWVGWAPAAFVGGLAYGFSAAVVVQLAFGWLNLACLALLPLMVACADELLIRQRARPIRVGAALAVLLTVEFFISTEMVLIVTVSGVVAVILLVAYGARHDRSELRRRRRHALTGIGTAAALTLALLAYPLWFFLAGPAHLGGMLWSTNVPGNLGNAASNFWSDLARWGPLNGRQLAQGTHVLGGYLGPALPSPSYLGPGLLLVIGLGTLVWRTDRRLWFFGALGVLTAAVSLRAGAGTWAPWAVVDHLPLFDNVVQSRFAAVFGLCAAAMVAVIVDRSRTAALERFSRRGAIRPAVGRWRAVTTARWGAGAVALVVSLVALGPVFAALAPNVPLTVQPVTVPHWFATTATHLSSEQVLATYPFATADSQASMPWQAIPGLHYKMAGGGGPAGTVARAGADKVGFNVLNMASSRLGPAPAPTVTNVGAVRRALRHWGVTMVVVPDDRGLPVYETGRGAAYGVAFFTAVLGSAPVRQDGAWVWPHVDSAPPPVSMAASSFSACTQAGPAGRAALTAIPRCVLTAGAKGVSTGPPR